MGGTAGGVACCCDGAQRLLDGLGNALVAACVGMNRLVVETGPAAVGVGPSAEVQRGEAVVAGQLQLDFHRVARLVAGLRERQHQHGRV